MLRAQPPAPSRIRVLRQPGLTTVVVRPRRAPFTLLVLPVWLAGWACGEAFAVRQLLRVGLSGASAFLVLWLTLWTLAGATALYALAYALAGREEIGIHGGTLVLRRGVGPVGRTRAFDLGSLSRLRAEPTPRHDLAWPGAARGAIAFDYGARSHRLGDGLEGTDVSTVLELIEARVPVQRTAF
jgi:hypothetical protein